ncbi:MAG: hypothetical protein ACO1SV_00720 [Fimbriimonas sp.]
MLDAHAQIAALERQVLELRSAVSSLGRAAAPVPKSRRTRSETVRAAAAEEAAPSGPPFTLFPPDGQAILGDGTGAQAETTADVAAHAGEGATYAYVRFSASAGEDGASIAIGHRPLADGAWAIALHLIAIQEAADSATNDNSEWVVLAEDGTFRYQIEGEGDASWSLTLLGYA